MNQIAQKAPVTFGGDDSNIIENFFKVIDALVTALAQRGVDVKARNPARPVFLSLNVQQKVEALKQAQVYLNFVSSVREPIFDARNELRAFEFFFGVGFSDEVFEAVGADDVIEVYTSENIQVWRNLNFFKICSYSLEELFSENWMDRYVRDPRVMGACIGEVIGVQDPSRPPVNSKPAIPVHHLYETTSFQQLVLRGDFHCLARSIRQSPDLPKMWMGASRVTIVGTLAQIGDPFKLAVVNSPEPVLSASSEMNELR
jgi:hypothetical protein